MENEIYAVWLVTCLGAAFKKSRAIIESFESSRQIYEADERELRLSGIFSNGEISKLMQKNKIELAKHIYSRAIDTGSRVVTTSSAEYPENLKNIPIPPLLLYIKGKIPVTQSFSVSLVGTREASMAGQQTSFDLSYNLAKNNVLIVSGGAQGIDTQAHKGALLAGGQTLCVLGCGTETKYNMNNSELRNEIIKHGAIISEYPPDAVPASYFFPQRNRLIAAFSDCCVVVEGGLGSGSLITAAKAAELSKKVFAVPGSIDNPRCLGSNMLLTAGAIAAVNYRDILKWFTGGRTSQSPGLLDAAEVDRIRMMKPGEIMVNSVYYPDEEKEKTAKSSSVSKRKAAKRKIAPAAGNNKQQPAGAENTPVKKDKNNNVKNNKKSDNNLIEMLTTNAKSVYDTISETPTDADTICRTLGTEISTVLSALTELEIFGFIESCGIGSYKRKEQ